MSKSPVGGGGGWGGGTGFFAGSRFSEREGMTGFLDLQVRLNTVNSLRRPEWKVLILPHVRDDKPEQQRG